MPCYLSLLYKSRSSWFFFLFQYFFLTSWNLTFSSYSFYSSSFPYIFLFLPYFLRLLLVIPFSFTCQTAFATLSFPAWDFCSLGEWKRKTEGLKYRIYQKKKGWSEFRFISWRPASFLENSGPSVIISHTRVASKPWPRFTCPGDTFNELISLWPHISFGYIFFINIRFQCCSLSHLSL